MAYERLLNGRVTLWLLLNITVGLYNIAFDNSIPVVSVTWKMQTFGRPPGDVKTVANVKTTKRDHR